jgi:hypothetical protein
MVAIRANDGKIVFSPGAGETGAGLPKPGARQESVSVNRAEFDSLKIYGAVFRPCTPYCDRSPEGIENQQDKPSSLTPAIPETQHPSNAS